MSASRFSFSCLSSFCIVSSSAVSSFLIRSVVEVSSSSDCLSWRTRSIVDAMMKEKYTGSKMPRIAPTPLVCRCIIFW